MATILYSLTLLLLSFYFVQPLTIALLIDRFDETTKNSGHQSDLNNTLSWSFKELIAKWHF